MRFPWRILVGCLAAAVFTGQRVNAPKLKNSLPLSAEISCRETVRTIRSDYLRAYAFLLEEPELAKFHIKNMKQAQAAAPAECQAQMEPYLSRLKDQSFISFNR